MTTPMNPADPPVIKVVAGHPTAEEIAALVTVLARRGEPPAEPDPPVSNWAAYWRRARQPLQPGADAWRHSLRT